MYKNKNKIPDMHRICAALAGTVTWHHMPDGDFKQSCRRFLEKLSGNPHKVLSGGSLCAVKKQSYRKLILMQVHGAMQLYFKIYLPDFSWRWWRGFCFFTPPALREAGAITLLHRLGIGAVNVIGTATLPWKRTSVIQPVSVLITASKAHVRKLSHPATYSLPAHRKKALAARIIHNAATLHKHGFGNLDMHPNNILVDRKETDVLLCDMERLSPLRPWNKYKRIAQDHRKLHSTLSLLLKDIKIIGVRQHPRIPEGLTRYSF